MGFSLQQFLHHFKDRCLSEHLPVKPQCVLVFHWCSAVTVAWDRQGKNIFSAWFALLRSWDWLPRDPIRWGDSAVCARRHVYVHAWEREREWARAREEEHVCAHIKERGRVWERTQMMLLVGGDGAGSGFPFCARRFPSVSVDLCVLSFPHLTFLGKSCWFFCCWRLSRLP